MSAIVRVSFLLILVSVSLIQSKSIRSTAPSSCELSKSCEKLNGRYAPANRIRGFFKIIHKVYFR